MVSTNTPTGHQISNLAASAGVTLQLSQCGDDYVVTGSKMKLPIPPSKLFSALQDAIVQSGAGDVSSVARSAHGVKLTSAAVAKLSALVGEEMEQSLDASGRVTLSADTTMAGRAFTESLRKGTLFSGFALFKG
jgi:hypothetical protein